MTGAGKGESGSGHTGGSVDGDGVGLGRAGPEVGELHEGVVVPVDGEGARLRRGVGTLHRDGRGLAGLDPHGRGRLVDVAQERPDEQGAVGRHGWRQHLDRAALVHRAIALGRLLQRQGQVEDQAGVDRAGQHPLQEVGEVAAHGRHAAGEADVLLEHPAHRQLDAVRDARRSPTVEPGRATAKAVFIDSSVPTHSSTASAPTPAVSSAMRAPPSLPRSATMSVAPKAAGDLLARLVARHGDDALGAQLGRRPAPRTARPHRRRSRRRCRRDVRRRRRPRASRWPSRRRGPAARGSSSRRGSPSVFTRLPSAWVTREYSPCPLAVKPRLSQTDCTPARQCAQVLSQWQNGTMTKSPDREVRHLAPTSSMTPTHSWPIVDAGVDVVVAAVGPQVRAADAARDHLDDRVRGLPR